MARVSACQKYPNKLTLGAFCRLSGPVGFMAGMGQRISRSAGTRPAITGPPYASRLHRTKGSPVGRDGHVARHAFRAGADVRRVHRHYFSSLCATAGRCGSTASSCMTSRVTVATRWIITGIPNGRLHRVYPEASSLNSLGAMFGLVLRHEAACAKHPRLPRSRRSAIEPLATSFQSGIPPASVGFRSSRPAQRTTFGWWIVATMPRKSALNSLASLWPVVLGAVGMGYLLAYAI